MATHDESGARLAAFGDQLTRVHRWLRAELARLHDEVDAFLDGGTRPTPLQAHCVAFCAALERHHTGEDDGAFPALAEQHPELAPLLDKLRQEHRLVSDILRRLTTLVGELGPQASGDPREAGRVRGEVDGLSAILESHFGFEERSIVTALNALSAQQWTSAPPAFLRTDPTV